MQVLESAIEKAEYCLELARQRPTKLKGSAAGSSKWKSIHQKLAELYIEENAKPPKHKGLLNSSHLLEKLVSRDKLNCLIVNLYPGNEGYSLMLKGRGGTDTETMRLPYEEAELLQCINNEELPPILVDLLDRSPINMFYSGCVIVEVRDYRRSSNPATFECHHVLLKPTTQTLLCDVNSITSDSTKWTAEDKQLLESQLLLATQEPLCLNPSVSVALIANRLQYNRNKFNTVQMYKTVKKYSQAAINRKRKFEHCAAPRGLKLHDFVSKRKDPSRNQTTVGFRLNKQHVEAWKETSIELTTPDNIEVEKYAKALQRPKTPEHDIPELVEEYTMESELNHGKISHTRLTIKRLPIEEVFVGELYIDKDFMEGVEKGTAYKFSFGTRDLVDRYIKQFTEIVTEEGRKSVKITHLVPGLPPKITNTHGSQEVLATMIPTMPQTAASSPGAASKPTTSRTTAAGGSTNMMSPPPKTPSPGCASIAPSQASNRGASRQAAHGASNRPSSVSPGPASVTSPVTSTATSVAPLGLISGMQLGITGILTGGGDPTTGLAPPMSLAGMSMPTGIAVPISLAMMHATQANIMTTSTPSGVIVSSMPGLVGASALSSTTSSQAGSAGNLVTAVTTSGISVGTSAVIVTSGMLTSPSTVLATPTSVLSLPISMTGSLNQLMASSLKGARAAAPPLSLLQVSGSQPTISLFSPLPRPPQPPPIKPSGGQVAAAQHPPVIPSPPARSGPTPPPAQAVTSTQPLLTALLPQPQAILAYSKQPAQQTWPQTQPQAQQTKPPPKRKRSTSAASPREQHNSRTRDASSKNK